MKYLLLFLFVLTYTSITGQIPSSHEKVIQRVKEIDNSKNQLIAFSTTSNDYFAYKTSNGKFVKLIHRFKTGNAKTGQLFYINNDALVYSVDEVLYFSKDSSSWRGTYFFVNGKLKDYETLGHCKSELDDWEPEKEVTRNYKRVKNIVVAHIRKKGEPK